MMIEGMIARHRESGASADQTHRIYRKLKQVLADACLKDCIMRNPADKVHAPKLTVPEIHYLDQKDVTRLVSALDEAMSDYRNKYRPDDERHAFTLCHVTAVRVALATGVRRGELLGLVWGCVDFEAGTVRTKQQMTSYNIRTTKTRGSNRVITIDGNTWKHLTRWKAVQADYLLRVLGTEQTENIPVFCNEVAGWQNPNNFSSWWRSFCKAHGFDGLKFHDLRHTQATLLLVAGGCDLTSVAARLGHSQTSTTLDRYASVIPGMDEAAALFIGSILSGEKHQKNKLQTGENRMYLKTLYPNCTHLPDS